MSSITIKPRLVFLTIACCCFLNSSPANPKLTSTTDGSMGAKVTLTGNFEVPQSLGKTVGNNLFHSFSSFNIEANKTATFTGSNSLQNVFTRVTGSDKSQFNGTLKSNIEHADFYFINPNGVIFGKDSQINVPASFYISTAEQLHFHDGAVFNTNLLNHSSLTAEKPEAYGFLTDRSNEIAFMGTGSKTQVDDYYQWTGTNLQLNPNKTFEIVAGNIDIKNTRLKSESGNFYLIAQNHAGIVPLNTASNNATGNIDITGSWLDARGINDNGEGVGFSVLRGGDINMTNSLLYETNASATNATPNAGIDISANNLQLTDSEIHTEAEKNGGDTGEIKVVVDNLSLNNSTIDSLAYSDAGNAGMVTIQVAKDLNILNGSFIGSVTWSEGSAGNIAVQANNITIDGQNSVDEWGNPNLTGISSSAYEDSSGNAGAISINIANKISLHNGGIISSDTNGAGNAGDIIIHAKNLIINGQETIDEKGNSAVSTGISSNTLKDATGNAGTVKINASHDINIDSSGAIQSVTENPQGKAGTIDIHAERVVLDGKNYDGVTGITVTARKESSGQIGSINIAADKSVFLSNGARITMRNRANVIQPQLIDLKQITISSPILNIDSQSYITSESFENIAASNILLNINHWLALQSAEITTSVPPIPPQETSLVTDRHNNGGDITINSPVILLNTATIKANTVANDARGGQITINTQALIPSGNTLNADVFGYNIIQADAPHGINGIIRITSPQLNLSGVLANLQPANFEHQQLIADVCNTKTENSLTRIGRGGLLPSAADVLGF